MRCRSAIRSDAKCLARRQQLVSGAARSPHLSRSGPATVTELHTRGLSEPVGRREYELASSFSNAPISFIRSRRRFPLGSRPICTGGSPISRRTASGSS
jgi:hypothetical protein